MVKKSTVQTAQRRQMEVILKMGADFAMLIKLVDGMHNKDKIKTAYKDMVQANFAFMESFSNNVDDEKFKQLQNSVVHAVKHAVQLAKWNRKHKLALEEGKKIVRCWEGDADAGAGKGDAGKGDAGSIPSLGDMNLKEAMRLRADGIIASVEKSQKLDGLRKKLMAQARASFRKGDCVLYVKKSGEEVPAKIIAVHPCTEPYYTITFMKGRSRQTVASRLKPK